jgi:protein-disulfide isomerase
MEIDKYVRQRVVRIYGLHIVITVIVVFCAANSMAAVDWSMKNQLTLESVPLDNSVSPDGKFIYVLVSGKILVYSMIENKIIDFMPVDRKFDHLSVTGKGKLFFLSSSRDNSINVFEKKKTIDLTGLPFLGQPDARVVVAVFSDYQCPYCSRLDPLLKKVLEKYPKDVMLVFKNFPLPFHSYAKKAATAALAAQEQGKFCEFHNKLFAAGSLNDQKIQDIAKELKLDMNKFNEKLKDPAVQKIIDRDIADGHDNDVSGTPTIFVNGNELRDRSLEGFARMIDAELKR